MVVSPDIGFRDARKAYPWYGPGYDPEVNRYTLPYDLREIELLGPFDYGAMKDGSGLSRARSRPASATGSWDSRLPRRLRQPYVYVASQ